MPNILIVLPYSGAQFTGGLAVVNEQISNALAADSNNNVKLLTFQLNEKAMAKQEGHGNAEILAIKGWPKTIEMQNPGGRDGGRDRDRLYELINSEEVILGDEVNDLLEGWEPDLILGHSRFSGPAAIQLRDNKFQNAKVGYFLHSYPLVEGVLLQGYEAFGEHVNEKSSLQKLAAEKEWIHKADVVLAMGPLMRQAATLMLKDFRNNPDCKAMARVHEVIPGILEPNLEQLPPLQPAADNQDKVTLLLSGRANAPVKGFQDILTAAAILNEAGSLDRQVSIKVRGMSEAKYPDREQESGMRTIDHNTVNEWTKGALGPGPVSIDVLDMVSQADVIQEYLQADAVLSAAYIEHFGLVPIEALSCGRPVLVSEFSGAGQFLDSQFGDPGKDCVVHDFTGSSPRPINSSDLQGVSEDAFDERPQAWAASIRDLVNNIDERKQDALRLKNKLTQEWTMDHFAKSIVGSFDSGYANKTTFQVANGGIEEKKKVGQNVSLSEGKSHASKLSLSSSQ